MCLQNLFNGNSCPNTLVILLIVLLLTGNIGDTGCGCGCGCPN